MNYFIDEQYRTDVIDNIAQEVDFAFKVEDFYVTPEHLKTMNDNGMLIGSHTHSHPVMSKLTRDEQHEEIARSFGYLDSLRITQDNSYCHPYGGFHSFNQDTVTLLKEFGTPYAFNVESREITDQDLLEHKLYLPRFDCNEFPHGKAS